MIGLHITFASSSLHAENVCVAFLMYISTLLSLLQVTLRDLSLPLYLYT